MAKKLSQDFLDNIAALATSLRQQIDASASGWDLSPEAIAERRRLVADPVKGYEYFDRTYFPHYGSAEPSALHLYLYERLPKIVASPAARATSPMLSVLVFVFGSMPEVCGLEYTTGSSLFWSHESLWCHAGAGHGASRRPQLERELGASLQRAGSRAPRGPQPSVRLARREASQHAA